MRGAVPALINRLDDLTAFPLYDDDPKGYVESYWRVVCPRIPQQKRGNVKSPVVQFDTVVRDAALRALPSITGISFEGKQSEQVTAWKKWWAEHKDEYP